MKIKSFVVHNYKSLSDTRLDELSNLTIFVGRNDSGKSNVLKAMDLFFNWHRSTDILESTTESSASQIRVIPPDNYLFEFSFQLRDYRLFHGKQSRTIVIEALLELSELELSFLPDLISFGDSQGPVQRGSFGNTVVVKESVTPVDRSIVGRVDYISLGSLVLLAPVGESQRALTRRDDGTYVRAELQNNNRNVAFQLLKDYVRGKFVLVPALRELSRESRTPDEPLPGGEHIASHYFRYEKDASLGKQLVFKEIQRQMTDIFPDYNDATSMEESEGKVDVHFGGYPSSAVGEGVKKHFVLSFNVSSNPNSILAIEEPEIHLHPTKQRDLYNFLAELSQARQLFLTTHSPVIASRPPLRDIRFVSINAQKVTKIERISEETVEKIIDDLGIKQSDFFDSDIVVFVEGQSDVDVFATLATKLRPQIKASFVDTEGWTNMEYYANTEVLASRRVDIIPFVIFDGDTENIERNKIVKSKLLGKLSVPEQQIITLSKNSIEDYLLIPRAIKEAFPSLTATKNEIRDFLNQRDSKRNKKQVLDEMLKTFGGGKYDETVDADRIAAMLQADEVDREIRDIIERIGATGKG